MVPARERLHPDAAAASAPRVGVGVHPPFGVVVHADAAVAGSGQPGNLHSRVLLSPIGPQGREPRLTSVGVVGVHFGQARALSPEAALLVVAEVADRSAVTVEVRDVVGLVLVARRVDEDAPNEAAAGPDDVLPGRARVLHQLVRRCLEAGPESLSGDRRDPARR